MRNGRFLYEEKGIFRMNILPNIRMINLQRRWRNQNLHLHLETQSNHPYRTQTSMSAVPVVSSTITISALLTPAPDNRFRGFRVVDIISFRAAQVSLGLGLGLGLDLDDERFHGLVFNACAALRDTKWTEDNVVDIQLQPSTSAVDGSVYLVAALV